jgi:hypothetical protein
MLFRTTFCYRRCRLSGTGYEEVDKWVVSFVLRKGLDLWNPN